ncbi:hypothetical protein MALH07_00711 [Mycoplasma anatis]|nr:hypothetical protein [Mycoplasmopsis anatis]MBW0601523.1 hypothetical protein [Mycoplasmopsis anatis]
MLLTAWASFFNSSFWELIKLLYLSVSSSAINLFLDWSKSSFSLNSSLAVWSLFSNSWTCSLLKLLLVKEFCTSATTASNLSFLSLLLELYSGVCLNVFISSKTTLLAFFITSFNSEAFWITLFNSSIEGALSISFLIASFCELFKLVRTVFKFCSAFSFSSFSNWSPFNSPILPFKSLVNFWISEFVFCFSG